MAVGKFCVMLFGRGNIDIVYAKKIVQSWTCFMYKLYNVILNNLVLLFIVQRFVAYTGNNMRKASPSPDPRERNKEV